MLGRTISHYKIVAKLGQGGMGVVYKAEDTKLERTVALKFLAPHLGSNPEVRQRFLREAKTAAALQHPNICTVYEVGEAEGETFIAMAYLEGEELASQIKKGPVDPVQLVGVASQVAQGLQKAHSKSVVHRDIKPANIMVTAGGRAVLMDFGLARVLSEASNLTREGTTLGTSAYMSPEQTNGSPLDHRTDIWALGVVMYEMATGQLPFQGHYEQAVIYSILNEPPESVRALRPEFPAELERIVEKCLAKDAGERYQSAGDLIADLKSLNGSPRREENAQTLPKTADEPPSIAVLPFENRGRGDEDEYFSDGISEDITSALGKLDGLQVTPRSMAFQFKGKQPLPEEVGQTLGVKHVLEGSVRRAGDRVRINVELIAIDQQLQIWAERYDRVMDDIFEIQDDISQSIVAQLAIQLVGAQTEKPARRQTENVEAYKLCLRGRYYWYRRTAGALKMAIECFEKSLAEDPLYALAYAGLADCYNSLVLYGSLSASEAMPRAKAAAERALEIDPELAAANASMGAVRALYYWDWSSAEREFRRAIELDSTYPVAHLWYASWTLAPQGRLDEALLEWRLAADLEPATPLFTYGPGVALVLQRQYDRAIEELHKTLEVAPNYGSTHLILGVAHCQMGDHEMAIAAFRRANVPPFQEGSLGYAYAVSGERAKARELIAGLEAGSQPEHLTPYQLALIHLGLGEKDAAMERLSQACDFHTPQLFWVNVLPEFDSVREDPRFQDILRRMNLAD